MYGYLVPEYCGCSTEAAKLALTCSVLPAAQGGRVGISCGELVWASE